MVVSVIDLTSYRVNKTEQGFKRLGSVFTFRIVLFLAVLILLVIVFDTSIVQSNDRYKEVLANTIWVSSRNEPRGLFYDRNGNLIAKNVDKYDLYFKHSGQEEKFAKLITKLTSEGFSPIDDDDFLTSESDQIVLRNLDSSSYLKVQEVIKKSNMKDQVYFKQGYKRYYLYPEEFAHIIGYTGYASTQDIEKGYEPSDQTGKYKLEYSLEDELKGIKGKQVYVDGVQIQQDGQAGNNVYLTIDLNWQKILYNSIATTANNLNAAGGAGVILNAQSGEVMAMVSYPGFDPNVLISGISQEGLDNLAKDRNHPMQDKALAMSAPPGSAFKLVTAYELLSKNVIDSATSYYSSGCIFIGTSEFCEFDKNAYGYMNVVRALYKSSNLFFCENTLNYSQSHSLDEFALTAGSFGIGELSEINIPGEIEGNMDSPHYRKASSSNSDWYPGDTCNVAIGQGSILVTPIQMVLLPSIYENGGKLFKPNVISKITNNEGETLKSPTATIKRQIELKPEFVNLIRSGMYSVANDMDGTVYWYLHDLSGDLRVKTGSSETFENLNGEMIPRVNGWIVGSFDYNGQTYSFSMFMPYSGGSFYMTQALRDFIQQIFR